ncbi:DNA polymerase III subunit delta' [Eubacteriaceae bacterium ES3]|nr:DNA polymerase III subunit delta' [Eubacteriaceae bacterium ES3]
MSEIMDRVIGHNQILEALKKQIQEDSVSHAYLFTGISGIGKRKTAKMFAAMMLCQGEEKPCYTCPSCKQLANGNYPDLMEISAEGATIKIAQVRAMINELSVKPYSGDKRIIIIDDAARMTVEAQNSLLKSLEEPLYYNLFILLTETPKQLLSTIRSRCQVYHFKPLAPTEIKRILLSEGSFSESEIESVLGPAAGSIEKALYFLNNPGILEERVSILRELYSLLRGDLLKIFTLSERMGSDKNKCIEMLDFLIRWFYELSLYKKGSPLPEGNEPGKVHQAFEKILREEKIDEIIQTLFEMMDRMQYNVNLSLQWEKTLIQMIKIQKG